jgi:hypothetical protein
MAENYYTYNGKVEKEGWSITWNIQKGMLLNEWGEAIPKLLIIFAIKKDNSKFVINQSIDLSSYIHDVCFYLDATDINFNSPTIDDRKKIIIEYFNKIGIIPFTFGEIISGFMEKHPNTHFTKEQIINLFYVFNPNEEKELFHPNMESFDFSNLLKPYQNKIINEQIEFVDLPVEII